MTETLCTSGTVKLQAGANATLLTAAQYTQLINEAEGFLSAQSRYDWVANYASVSAIGKTMLEDACASKAAIDVLKDDMGVYTSRTEAQTMIDVLWSKIVEIVNLLRDDKFKQFVISGTVA